MPVAMRYGSGGSSAGSSGTGSRLLWRNANPTSNFGAQTISVQLSGFSWIGIKSHINTSGTSQTPFYIFPIDDALHYIYFLSISQNRTGGRTVQFDAENNQITFGAASYNAATNNGYCIPVEIWGLVI